LPVFATYQGADQTRTAIERVIRRSSTRRCAGLIIPSERETTRVERAYAVPASKIVPIPNPVEIVPLNRSDRDVVRRQLGISSQTRVVAWHGRIQIDKKGLDVLMDAWDRVVAARPDSDVLLLLVGTGRNGPALRERIGTNPRIRWIDRYVFNRAELWSYLLAADVYTIPSRREGFAVAALEAMACGLPVVASDAPGVVDAVRRGEADGGLVVPRNDAAALAAALLDLIDQPERARRMGEVARRRIEHEFSLDVIGPALRRFFFPGA
jgi:starch synthase